MEQDLEQQHWVQAAHEGSTEAQVWLGDAWEHGTEGFYPDKAQAARWYTRAAEAGNPDGMLRLGRLLALEAATAQQREQARVWLRRAAAAGHGRAKYWLRWMRTPQRRFLGRWHRALTIVGFAGLLWHLLREPFVFDWTVVAIMLGVLVAGALGFGVALASSLLLRGDDAEDDERLSSETERPTLRRLWTVPSEDGLIAVPLLVIGINPLTALIAAVIFGALHYPAYSGVNCVVKAVLWFFLLLWVLPLGGIWVFVVGHLLWDLALVLLGRACGW